VDGLLIGIDVVGEGLRRGFLSKSNLIIVWIVDELDDVSSGEGERFKFAVVFHFIAIP
jgi:hypothetical protein